MLSRIDREMALPDMPTSLRDEGMPPKTLDSREHVLTSEDMAPIGFGVRVQ